MVLESSKALVGQFPFLYLGIGSSKLLQLERNFYGLYLWKILQLLLMICRCQWEYTSRKQALVGWIQQSHSSETEPCPRIGSKWRKPEEKHQGIGSLKIRNYTSACIWGRIYYVFILRQWKCCQKSFMRRFVAVIREVDPLPIEL